MQEIWRVAQAQYKKAAVMMQPGSGFQHVDIVL